MSEVVKTGIAALNELIGGGLDKRSVSLLVGRGLALSVFSSALMSGNLEKTSKSKFLMVTGKNDIDGMTLRAIKEMASKYGLVVVVTLHRPHNTNKDEVLHEVEGIVDNIFYLELDFCFCDTLVKVEVLKYRSRVLHDVKFTYREPKNSLND